MKTSLFLLVGSFFLLTSSPARADDAALSDGQILQFTHFANAGEIAQAKMAKTQAKDARVKKFAEAMIADHSAADKKGSALAKQKKLTLEDSADATALKTDADKNSDDLRAQSGADFDKPYVDTQVKEHQAVLDAVDNKL